MTQSMKETVNQIDLNWQWTKIKAMENIDINEYIFLARDNTKKIKNEKHYLAISISNIDIIRVLLQDNHHIYELLPEKQPVKLYFDLELEKDGIQDANAYLLLTKFLHWVNEQILIKFDIVMEMDDYIILDSNRDNKLSYHVISNTKICFENINTLKEFITYLYAEMEKKTDNDNDNDNDDFIWYHKDDKRFIFDRIPYNKDQCYRMLNQSKHGKEHILKYIGNNPNFNVLDSMVRIYNNTDDLRMIYSNSENIKEARKEKKETKQDKIIKTQSYVLTGRCLMEKDNIAPQFMKDKFPLFLQYLYLIPNESQPYDIYRNIGFALKSSGGSEKDFRNWSALSSKYLSKTGGKFIKNFNNFLIGKQCLKLPYLKQLAKECHPEYFDQGIELLDEYFHPNYDGIKTIEENTQYLSSLDHNIKEKVIILRGQLGGGKTTAIKQFIQDNEFKRILFVSPRITFSQFISAEFDTQFYLDEDVNLNGDRLTISVESLHKIELNTRYDVVIMDESEANLSVFSSLATIRENQLKCFEVLYDFIQKSKHVILASAFITKKTIDFAKSLNYSTVFINNTLKPILKKSYRFHEDILTMKLIESIQMGEKNFAVFSTKKQLTIVNDMIRGLEIYKNKNILIYSSDSDDSQIETLKNIHESWGNADLVMTTPSITVGNSYKPPIIDFDNIFCFAAPTCCVCDTFQSIKRVRETRSNTLYFSLPDKMYLDRNKRFAPYKLEILKNYDLINKQKTTKMKTVIQELINNYKNNIQVYEANYNKLYMLQSTLCNDRVKTPNALKDIVMFNFKEQTLSDCYYEQMFVKFLEINNYQYCPNNSIEMTSEEMSNYENLYKQSISSKIQYHHIPIIINEDVEIELIRKQTHKLATKLEKLQLEKHYMLHKINSDVNEDFKAVLFDLFISPTKKHVFYNAYEENLNDLDRSLIRGHHIDSSTKENMSSNPIKLSYIMKLNLHLGITNTCTLADNIPREKIESLTDYFSKEHGNINIVFGFTKSKSDKWNFSNNLILLKKMYKSWSNSEFKSISDIHKKVISCDFVPNICFYHNDTYQNPFKVIDITKTNSTLIPSISETLAEQSNIEKQLQEIKTRKIQRELDREKERIEDEKQTLFLLEREKFLDEQQTRFHNLTKKCIECKRVKCICIKIDTFFK